MVKQFSACAATHVEVAIHSSTPLESCRVEYKSTSALPTVLECEIEKALYLAALSDTRTILKNLSKLRATRVSKALVQFLRRYEIFAPLLARLTRNYWIGLTDEEKLHRANLRKQSTMLKREQELLDGIAVRKKIAKKFFKAHQLNQPIRLSTVELAWLDGNHECRAVMSVNSNFLIPSLRDAFDFSDEAYTQLAARLRFEMLTPDDVTLLKQYGVPIMPDNTISVEDSLWAREPYTKAVLYRLVKYRKDEQDAQTKRLKSASMPAEVSFKRVYLSEDETRAEPSKLNQTLLAKYPAQLQATSTPIAQPLKRIYLESDDMPCEITDRKKPSESRWIKEIRGKVLALFGISTKAHALAS